MKPIYLDFAAATPTDPVVIQAMQTFWTDNFYNPSATYLVGKSAKAALEQARAQITGLLGCRPAEFIFTAGASEANNLAIRGVMEQYPDSHCLISSIEHESVIKPSGLYKTTEIPVDDQGRILLNQVSNLITDNTVLISVMLVNNELGTIQPLKELAALVKTVRKDRDRQDNNLPLYLHTDAAQAPAYLDIHVSRLGVDLMSLNGGKIYGPKQTGGLFIKAGTKLRPQILGGGQEFGYRSGTENVAGIAGLAKALTVASANRRSLNQRVTKLRQDFEKQILERIATAHINGLQTDRAPHISSITLPGADNERLMMELDERGIQCAVGSACSASRDEASHVLSAIGLTDQEARASLRFSLGKTTSQKHLDFVVETLAGLTAYNR